MRVMGIHRQIAWDPVRRHGLKKSKPRIIYTAYIAHSHDPAFKTVVELMTKGRNSRVP